MNARSATRAVGPIYGLRWVRTGLLAALCLAVCPAADALVISEIMYRSEALDEVPDEFIELYNENLDPLDLSGYTICDGVDFTFPRGTFLEGHSFLVVCADADAIAAKYDIDNAIGNWTGRLANNGERVRVCSTGGAVVAEVDYNDRGKWPVGADGTGHTLALRSPYIDTDDADSWRLSEALDGTPGEANGPRFLTGGGFEPPSGGMDSQGFILEWLMLGPYTGSGCQIGNAAITGDWLREAGIGTVRQNDLVWRDEQVVDTDYGSARSTGLHPNAPANDPTVGRFASFGDTINLNDAVYPPNPEDVMSYSFVYVDNVTGSDREVDIGVASDDSIQVLVNGVSRHLNDVCRGVGNAGVIQDRFPATLNAGKNLIAVKVFERGGGWSFRLRIEGRGTGQPIMSNAIIQITTDVDAGLDFDGSGEPIEEPGEEPDPPGDPGDEPDASPVLINEGMFTDGDRWIELYNRTDANIDVSGYYLTDDPRDLTKAELPAGSNITPGGYLSFTDLELGLDFSILEIGDRVFVALVADSGEKVLDAYNFEPEFVGFSEARVPDGDSEFEGAADPTRDAANSMTVNQDIVINEIMYHPLGDTDSKEYIELYNRSDQAVDMTGWELTRGVDFVFPDGLVLGSDEYLVVARDPELIEAIYSLPAGSVFGPAQDPESLDDFGVLRDRGERVSLKDEMGRTVDTVRYWDGGLWPRWADGLGSSMELIDPTQDNRYAQAWDASDDSDKSEPQEFSYIGRHRGGESELHVLLNTRGITIVDDVSIVGGGVQHTDTPLIDDDEVWCLFSGDQGPRWDWN